MNSASVLLTSLCLLAGCNTNAQRGTSEDPIAGRHEISASRYDATTQPALHELYKSLSARIESYNSQTPIDGWRLNSEHLFIEDENLLKDVTDFSRCAGAIDLLFRRILDKNITDDELLKIGEIMVYFVEQQLDGDNSIRSELSTEVREAVESGRFQATEIRLGNAPVCSYILLGAQKASEPIAPETTKRATESRHE